MLARVTTIFWQGKGSSNPADLVLGKEFCSRQDKTSERSMRTVINKNCTGGMKA